MEDFYDDISEQVNEGFEFRDENGTSIFLINFTRYCYPYHTEINRHRTAIMKTNMTERIKYMVRKSVEKIGQSRTVKILEGPDKVGNSLACIVCSNFSFELFDWMKQLDIKPHTIELENQMVPLFNGKHVFEYLLANGVSPFVY